MNAVFRARLRRYSFPVFVLLVVAGLLAAPLEPVTQTIMAESRPLQGWRAPYRQEPVTMSETEPTPEETNGLTLMLEDGNPQPQAVETVAVAPAQPLSDAEVQPILDRLPPLGVETGDVEEFKLPPASLPPPRAGETIDETFPPSAGGPVPPEVPTGELQVLRYAPEGEIPIAPFLNVTFNQPMVPLTTLDELSAADVPVTLTPPLQGIWKWLGTTTLSFEYHSEDLNRFPMATEFTAEISAGTQSATGGVLPETVRWTFSTPPPTVQRVYPNFSPQPLNPLLFVAFDQAIEPAAVLETIQVLAGGQSYAVRLATEAEVAADPAVADYVKSVQEGRWLAFRAEQEFPTDTTVTVNIGPGTPSAEGPLTTPEVQSFSFQTFAPLRIVDAYCGYGGGDCPPLTPFTVRFNNQLDAKLTTNDWVTVEPTVDGLTVSSSWDTLQIWGATAGRTEYKVTISADVQDMFGQTLGESQVLTFRTGDAAAYLTGPNEPLITLDPSSSKPAYTIYTVNFPKVRVRAYAVTPADWPAYLDYLDKYWRDNSVPPPGKQVIDTIVDIQSEPDTLTETALDLGPALEGDYGQLIVVVDKPPSILNLIFPDRDYVVQSWVQVTDIGLDAIVDQDRMVAWATSLENGAPLEGVALELMEAGVTGTTAADGLATLALSDKSSRLLIGSLGDDLAILPSSRYYWDSSGWYAQPVNDQLRWYVFDDRQMYRPGEEAHVKGWVRHIGGAQDGDVSLTGLGGGVVRYLVQDPQGNNLTEGTAELNNLGGFDLAFAIPENSNLGYGSLQLNAGNVGNVSNQSFHHSFQIQEFRRPEFEVTARNESTGPYFLNDDAVVAVSAQYYAGGPLPNADTTWNVDATPTNYRPPGWSDFIFGVWQPWWYGYDSYAVNEVSFGRYGPGSGPSGALTFEGKTDPTGNHYLRMAFLDAEEARPFSILAEAVVMDVNRQAWAATTSLLMHPAEIYVGVRSQTPYVEQGDPLVLDLIVADVDGNTVADVPVNVEAVRMTWEFEDGQWNQVEVDPQTCELMSTADPVPCTFETNKGGEYHITAEVRDNAERINRTKLTRWVSGGPTVPSRDVEHEALLLVPDKESYQPGDVAKILVQAPFAEGEGLLTLARSGIVRTERFSLDGGTATLDIAIEEGYLPNLNVQVDVDGSALRLDDKGVPVVGAPPRPAYATASLNLPIPPLSRTLDVTIEPADTKLDPGSETSVAVTVIDATGEPVQDAELALVVVDEAVLALTNYQLADPLAAFYATRGAMTSSYYGRDSILLANPEDIADEAAGAMKREILESNAVMATAAPGMAMDAAAPMMEMAAEAMPAPSAPGEAGFAEPQPQIAVRTNFNPLALFAPAVRTDAAGEATVDYQLPDNLTRYRIMVVAATEQDFGSAESDITARLPLMVRPSAPRFLNFGDYVELPVVIQNQTDDLMSVDIVANTGNLLLEDAQGQRVEVPANDRVEVRFPVTTDNVGTARVQFAAVSGALADAATVSLPVYTPATTEAFAVYGVVDEGSIAQPVASPQDVFPQFGGLEINTSSTALSTLTDAMLYLQSYPFECSEQLAARIMSVAALRDVLTAFQASGLPSPEAIEAAIVRDITLLERLQNWDGGFPYWTKGKDSIPYNSIFVTHALLTAEAKGYDVPPDMLGSAIDYLRDIESYYPSWYSAKVRHTLSSYAVYVRMLIGDVDLATARNLYTQMPLADQSLEATAWLWQVLAGDPASEAAMAEIERYINNKAVETAGAANFITSYADQEYVMLHSNRRTDAVVLDALIAETPDSDLIPKVVKGLMDGRTQGRWGNTQENVFVLLAMDNYFNTFENVEPDFIARAWLGDVYVAEHPFQGYTAETRQTLVPMASLTQSGETEDLILSKDGDGRLYYRLGLRYAPTDLGLDPLDMGFVVERTYEAVDDPADVTRDEDGVWTIKAGARVRVRLTLVAVNRRYHVALVDRLPAGLEIINPDLAVSEDIPADPEASPYYWWWGTWYEHQNLRDAGAEAFTPYLWDGVYNYSYVARATTPGTYVVPPAKAEEMYSPEVFGRSNSDRVIVE